VCSDISANTSILAGIGITVICVSLAERSFKTRSGAIASYGIGGFKAGTVVEAVVFCAFSDGDLAPASLIACSGANTSGRVLEGLSFDACSSVQAFRRRAKGDVFQLAKPPKKVHGAGALGVKHAVSSIFAWLDCAGS